MNEVDMDRTFLALADPTRRAILARLSGGETCISNLARPFDMSLNAVSKHIRVLERARLVRRRRVWREFRVCIDPTRLNDVADWIATNRAAWMARLSALDALLVAEHNRPSKGKLSEE